MERTRSSGPARRSATSISSYPGAHTMHAFAYVHAFNALSGTCVVCATGLTRRMDEAVPEAAAHLLAQPMAARGGVPPGTHDAAPCDPD